MRFHTIRTIVNKLLEGYGSMVLNKLKQYYSTEIYTRVPKEFIKANEQNHIQEINPLMSFYQLLYAKRCRYFRKKEV